MVPNKVQHFCGIPSAINSIIICFGYQTITQQSQQQPNKTIILPITYTNKPKIITQKGNRYATSITYIGTTSWPNSQELVINISTSQFVTGGGSNAGYNGCNFIAIGY